MGKNKNRNSMQNKPKAPVTVSLDSVAEKEETPVEVVEEPKTEVTEVVSEPVEEPVVEEAPAPMQVEEPKKVKEPEVAPVKEAPKMPEKKEISVEDPVPAKEKERSAPANLDELEEGMIYIEVPRVPANGKSKFADEDYFTVLSKRLSFQFIAVTNADGVDCFYVGPFDEDREAKKVFNKLKACRIPQVITMERIKKEA